MSPIDIDPRVAEMWKTHETITLHEDGMYRHYRVNLPENHSWVEIITWPGHLTITGDLSDSYVFEREPDMLRDFFHAEMYVDIRYWASKLTNPNRYESTHKWDDEKFMKDVRELHADGYIDATAVENAEWVEDRNAARQWQGEQDDGGDLGQPGMTWTRDFVRACHLIALFADEYRENHK